MTCLFSSFLLVNMLHCFFTGKYSNLHPVVRCFQNWRAISHPFLSFWFELLDTTQWDRCHLLKLIFLIHEATHSTVVIMKYKENYIQWFVLSWTDWSIFRIQWFVFSRLNGSSFLHDDFFFQVSWSFLSHPVIRRLGYNPCTSLQG